MATTNTSTSPGSTPDAPVFLANTITKRSLKMWIIGVILSALAYGIEMTLAYYCFQLLTKSSRQHTSRRTRRVLLYFVALMCLMGTAALVLNINSLINSLTTPFQDFEKISIPAQQVLLLPFTPVDLTLIVLATWGSHGSMVWRCNALYADLPRLKRILFVILAGLVVLTSFIFGILNIIILIPFIKANPTVDFAIGAGLLRFEIASHCTNLTLSLLSAGRILYHIIYLRKIFGKGHTTVYQRIIMILVESSSLPLVPDVLLLVAAGSPTETLTRGVGPSLIRDLILAHQKLILRVNIIAPLLIIFRVAQGQTLPSNTQRSAANIRGSLGERHLGNISTLRFGVAGSLEARDSAEAFGRGADIGQEVESGERNRDREKVELETPLRE